MARSILSTIMAIESGGRNVPQRIDDINMRRGTPAQGYFQITDPTWAEFGGGKTDYKSAIHAPYSTQRDIALNIPVERWGPATQSALQSAGYVPQPGETLGQMLKRYGEDPSAATPADAGAGVPSTATASTAAPTMPTPPAAAPDYSKILGLLTQQEQDKQEKATTQLAQEGLGLLGKATTSAPADAMQPMPERTVQAQPLGWMSSMPDFTQMLAQQRLQRRM